MKIKYDLDSMLQECINQAKDMGMELFPIQPKVLINPRLKSCWARCCYRRDIYNEWYCYIEFAKRTLDSPNKEEVMNSMMHEVIHTGIDCIHEGHKGAWKMWANKANDMYGYHISRTASSNEFGVKQRKVKRLSYKYEIYCPRCNATWKYKRFSYAVQNPETSICCRCNMPLKSRGINGYEILRAY